MFSNHKTFLRLTCVGGLFTLVAACAQPTTPTPIRADIYLPKYSPAESEFCQMDIGSLSAAQVAEIRNDPNYDANLARWLEECPETALAFADLATASTATGPRTPGGKSGPIGGRGPGGGGNGGDGGNGGNGGGNNGGGGDNGGGKPGGGKPGDGKPGGGKPGDGKPGGGKPGGGKPGDGKPGGGKPGGGKPGPKPVNPGNDK